MLPGIGSQLNDIDLDEVHLRKIEGIVHSMTAAERREPDIIDSSRRRRIAAGSGAEPHDVSGLVKTFERSRDLMKVLSSGGLGGFKSLLTGGLSMDALGAALASGKKIKQRSRRKQIIKRRGKIQRR